jgi:hypothetical protein
MRKAAFFITGIVLAACLFFLFRFPAVMLSPGALTKGHEETENKCFACHTAFRSTPDEKCTQCHVLSEIGRDAAETVKKDTGGPESLFHQYLTGGTCVSCHTDHKGKNFKGVTTAFRHTVLDSAVRRQCNVCHRGPDDVLHRKSALSCSRCHNTEKWTPALFDHKPLSEFRTCKACHQKPGDVLHRKVTDECSACHNISKWKPAAFEHEEYFRFDKEHTSECETCHPQNDFSRYSCYGCHEHEQRKMKKEHLEEGIKDYENCTRCHRSGDEDEAKMLMR